MYICRARFVSDVITYTLRVPTIRLILCVIYRVDDKRKNKKKKEVYRHRRRCHYRRLVGAPVYLHDNSNDYSNNIVADVIDLFNDKSVCIVVDKPPFSLSSHDKNRITVENRK